MELYRINVARKDAGKSIPFDRVYLAHGEARRTVKRLFGYALVLPMTPELRGPLSLDKKDVPPWAPDKKPELYPHDGPTRELDLDWAEKIEDHSDWVLVVPILPKLATHMMPSYLVNNRWYLRKGSKNPIPSLAYLQTPEQNYRPVCVACPRFSEHMGGVCQPGQSICYKTLVLGETPTRKTEALPDFRDVREGT